MKISTNNIPQLKSDFIDLINQSFVVKSYGDEFKKWSKNVFLYYVRNENLIAFGGRIIPQMGPNAGMDNFVFEDYFEQISEFDLIKKNIDGLIEEFWSGNREESKFYSISFESSNNSLHIGIIPISNIFNKPIGYFWYLSYPDFSESIFSKINNAISLITYLLHYEKIQHSMDFLSKPVWRNNDSIENSAQNISKLCKDALSCCASYVWQIKKGKKVDRLITIATSGTVFGTRADMDIGEGVAGKCVEDSITLTIDDLLDNKELNKYNIKKVSNLNIVIEKNLRSGIFIPLDVGTHIAGVFALYSERKCAFSDFEKKIGYVFSQRICSELIHLQRLKELTEKEKRLELAAPIIETGLSATENMHDVNSNMLLIQNSIETIKQESKRAHPLILKSANKIGKLVYNSSRIIHETIQQTKLKDLNIEKTDFYNFLDEINDLLKDRLSRIFCKTYINCPKDLIVYIDRVKIRRVFMNLFDNSLYFLEHDSKGDQRKIEINVNDTGSGTIKIKFKDNGRGIQDTEIQHIFDFLYSTKFDDGSGLGLAIVRLILKYHNGYISVISEHGYFTEFEILLPKNCFKK